MKKLDDDNRILLFKLQDLGISYIQGYYEGSGDSGAIEEILYIDNKKAEIKNLSFEDFSEDNYIHHEDLSIDKKLDSGLEAEIEDIMYNLLEDIEDWYNNDGGFGIITINVFTGECNINNNVRYVETHFYGHSKSLF
jgi:hypothetical protein